MLSQPCILPAEMPGQQGAESVWLASCQQKCQVSRVLSKSAWHFASRSARSAWCWVSLASCQQKCQVSRVLNQPGILPAEMPGQQGAESAWHLASRNARSARCWVSLASCQKKCQVSMVLSQPGICQQKCQVSRVLSQPGILPAKMPGQHGAELAWHLASSNANSAWCWVSLASCQQKCQVSRVLSQPGSYLSLRAVSRILSLPLSRKAASQHFCYFKIYLKIASLSIPIDSLGKENRCFFLKHFLCF